MSSRCSEGGENSISTQDSDSVEEKRRHLQLAGVVKGIHAKLRKKYKQTGDLTGTWKEHCKNESLLSEYADAMHHLATEIWTKRPETRIDWCRHVCHQYFFEEDGLKMVLDKEERRRKFDELAKERLLAAQNQLDSPNISSGSTHNSSTGLRYTPFSANSSLGGSHAGTPHLSSDDLEQLAKDIDNCPKCTQTNINIKVEQCEDNEINGNDMNPSKDGALDLPTKLLKVKNGAKSLPRDQSMASTLESAQVSLLPQKSSAHCSDVSDPLGDSFLDEYEFVSSGQEDSALSSCQEEGAVSFMLGDEDGDLDADRKAVYGKYKPVLYNTISLPFSGKIRLLDVGSCFNPFLQFEEFQSIGIDISPAVESVYSCDFLSVDTTEPLQLAPDTIESYMNTMKSPVERIPRDLFHVVVFSLLLEYFPSPYQRWICCQKAHNLLMMNGLLLIITPDSHSQHKNAPQMKSWKRAIESLGFKRWKYVKQEHLHCMAFRKVTYEQSILVNDISADMLYIPQDFNDSEDCSQSQMFNEDFFESPLRTDEENAFLSQCYTELPDLISD